MTQVVSTRPFTHDDSNRNYAKEMRDLIDQQTNGVSYTAATAAQEIVKFLRTSDPELLAGWLDVQAVQMVREAIVSRDHSRRSYNRVAASRSVFRKAADEYERTGNDAPLRSQFLIEVYTLENGTRMLLQDMTAAELSYVADEFKDRAKDSLLQEAFLRALAKKAGNNPVGNVMTEEQVARLWLSISGAGK